MTIKSMVEEHDRLRYTVVCRTEGCGREFEFSVEKAIAPFSSKCPSCGELYDVSHSDAPA